MTSLQERMQNKNFIIVDIEAIKTSEVIHPLQGWYERFGNCKWLCELFWKEKQSFFYCQRYIHKLNFYPPRHVTLKRKDVPSIVRNFNQNVSLMLYKGVSHEKELVRIIGMDSINIEDVGI